MSVATAGRKRHIADPPLSQRCRLIEAREGRSTSAEADYVGTIPKNKLNPNCTQIL
jgi:hypothetical protein